MSGNSSDTDSASSIHEGNRRIPNSPASSESDGDLDSDLELELHLATRAYKTVYVYDIEDMTLLSKKQLIRMMDFELGNDFSFLTRRWAAVLKCLSLVGVVAQRNALDRFANLVICKDEVSDAQLKLDFAGHSREVFNSNIYSTATSSTKEVLENIQTKYRKSCKIVVISSSLNTIRVAEELLLHVWPIRSDENFESLYEHQRDHWMARERQPTTSELRFDQIAQQIDNERREREGQIAGIKVMLLRRVCKAELEIHCNPDAMYQVLFEEVCRQMAPHPWIH